MSKQALVDHLLAHAVRRGDFVLKSGKPTTWFIDAKQTTCSPDGEYQATFIATSYESPPAVEQSPRSVLTPFTDRPTERPARAQERSETRTVAR